MQLRPVGRKGLHCRFRGLAVHPAAPQLLPDAHFAVSLARISTHHALRVGRVVQQPALANPALVGSGYFSPRLLQRLLETGIAVVQVIQPPLQVAELAFIASVGGVKRVNLVHEHAHALVVSRLLAPDALGVLAQLVFLASPFSFALCLGTTLVRGIAQAPLSAFIFSMIGDVVEYGQWKTHMRQESYIFSGGSVGAKVGMGAASAIITGIMSLCGYISSTGANVIQPQSAIDSICYIYISGPLVLFILLIVVCALYRLDKMYPAIMEELAARESQGRL